MRAPPYPHVLFDLDGTLIDSAPAILASFADAFARCGIEPVRPIDENIIGPPLLETLALLCGNHQSSRVEALAEAFKASYDSTGYRATEAYAGVADMLASLNDAGCRLAIATNKRIHPTRLILEHLGWSPCFAAVYALDLFATRLADKPAMIARLLADHGIDRADAVYVGDREEDGLAADANGLPFFAATWGYGSLPHEQLKHGWRAAADPAELLRLLT
ncbi:MAG: HAD hydrolase-like protein [Rhodocyclaceae bacterium]|nr:HAD hydrolase-like protein [Rhodocyclaceae bacterium]